MFANASIKVEILQPTPNGMRMKPRWNMWRQWIALPIALPTSTGWLHADMRESLCQTKDNMEMSALTQDMHSLRHLNSSFILQLLPSVLVKFTVNAIRLSATTSEEQALGFLEEDCKLKKPITLEK